MATLKKTPAGKWEVKDKSTTRRFTSKRTAEEFKRKYENELERERAGLVPRERRVTYGELRTLYFECYPSKPQSRETAKERLKHTDQFENVLVTRLDSETLHRWLQSLASYKPSYRRGIRKAFSAVLNFGVRLGYLPGGNPLRHVQLPPEANPPIRPFESWDEVYAVAAEAGRHGPAIIFACATALRPQELLALRWMDLDIPNRSGQVNQVIANGVPSPDAKTKESNRTFQLPQRALDALSQLPTSLDRTAPVFPNRYGNYYFPQNFRLRVFQPAIEAAKLERRGLKETRHTFATLALDAGLPIELVSRQLRHTDIATTLKYYSKWLRGTDERFLRILDADTSDGKSVVEAAESI